LFLYCQNGKYMLYLSLQLIFQFLIPTEPKWLYLARCLMDADTGVSLVPGQMYQLPGGHRQGLVSVTEDDNEFDWVLVLQPEGGGKQVIMMASQFVDMKPELVH